MDQDVFKRIRRVVYERSGISLSDKKVALVSARIGKRMRVLGVDDHRVYLETVLGDETGEELIQLLDAISTNVTSFFRESAHFEFLKERIEKWVSEGQERFRIWSSACSTGEEPYTIAMTALEALNGRRPDVKILATDISTRVLAHGKTGVFRADKVQPVPEPLRSRYFIRRKSREEDSYEASDELKKMIFFRRMNLSQPPFPMKGPMDVIFCRNVMIYFDNVVRKRLLSDMHRLLRPGGYLLVGHAESLTGMVSDFQVVRPSIYVKK